MAILKNIFIAVPQKVCADGLLQRIFGYIF